MLRADVVRSSDRAKGASGDPAALGKDEGKYGFRQWQAQFTLPSAGKYSLLTRCTNNNGVAQPDTPNWNPAGLMRNVVESVEVIGVSEFAAGRHFVGHSVNAPRLHAATAFELKPVKVDLPDSDKMFPDRPGSDAINNNCLACHRLRWC